MYWFWPQSQNVNWPKRFWFPLVPQNLEHTILISLDTSHPKLEVRVPKSKPTSPNLDNQLKAC